VLEGLLEIALMVSAAAYLVLWFYCLLHRDGKVWTIFQWHTFSLLVTASFGALAVRHMEWDELNEFAFAGIVLVCVGRLAGSVTSLMLALHMRDLIRKGRRGR
jgi:hypothetical protein